MKNYITSKDASLKLGTTEQHIRTLCRDNKFNAEKIGNTWLIEKESFNKYKNKNIVEDKGNILSKKTSKPKLLSFFSGAMGLDLGLEKAGFETILACEADKYCRQTIKENKPNIALIGDISNPKYTKDEIRKKAGLLEGEDIELIIGGPPCQAFSTAGKRQGFEDERGNVFLTFIQRVIELNPKYLVIENVRGLLSAPYKPQKNFNKGIGLPPKTPTEEKGGALFYIIQMLESAGYGVSFELYNSANFGTPQKRERVILICSRDGRKLPYLTPTHSENGEFGLPKWRTFRDAIKDLKVKTHNYVSFSEKRLPYYKYLKSGQYWKHLPENIKEEAMGKSYFLGGGKTGFYRRLDWDSPSPTLVTHPAMPATSLAHPEEDRPISIQEYKRIQEFPDDWILDGNIVQQYKQIGNAVPIGVGKAIGQLILNDMKNIPNKEYKGFKYSRYTNTNDFTWLEDYIKRSSKQK
ncbi:DNA cytosine methyltransferase [Aliarcobacter cryaerophilus]|uniref:Cytosine-specific methyltransferase n=1 Tax=Arcobacter sp. AZ-2023 TaxID=3074453 RepID=A0AA96DL40_9BACT|nr:DNA cytosine methyltransferase [Arcobacter sp. AZ-2023]